MNQETYYLIKNNTDIHKRTKDKSKLDKFLNKLPFAERIQYQIAVKRQGYYKLVEKGYYVRAKQV